MSVHIALGRTYLDVGMPLNNLNTIVFFSDRHALPGLHVALLSLVDSLDSMFPVRILVFADRISEKDKKRLVRTHQIQEKNTYLDIIDYSPKALPGSNSLHGNQTTYGRLYISELLPDIDKCLYLDCDLVINRDISEIFNLFDAKHTLLVIAGGQRGGSIDDSLFRQAGVPLKGPYFNAGVMGIDLSLWRQRGRVNECKRVARKHNRSFRASDQSLLNVVFYDDFLAIDEKFNSPLFPSCEPISHPSQRIYHFVGSPKPWDICGSKLHNSFEFWLQWYAKTAIGNIPYMRYISVRRSIRISRMIAKTFWSKFVHS